MTGGGQPFPPRPGPPWPGSLRPALLGPGREFDRIRAILSDIPNPGPDVRVGPGDDGAVFSDGLAISTDLSIEGVHFRLDWISPEEAGYRAAAAGLSDLAAMAAEPIALFASVAAPGDGTSAETVMQGVKRLAARSGIPLLGGDLTRSPGPLVVDVVSVGRSLDPLLRSGAGEGDELWVTGTLGGAAAAVALWSAGRPVPAEARRAFAEPSPRVREAIWLRRAGATAGIDLSDGIAGDAAHLAAASGVSIVLIAEALPVHPALSGADFPPGVDALGLALHGGEDYELLVAAPKGVLVSRVEEFSSLFDLPLTRVGRADGGAGVFLASGAQGDARRLLREGFDQFGAGGPG
ncbi:MAG: thiamine-phosphate kinase [Gemmatimonadetes bacterium]|nr:thiamine-phosphate kinase [Gemmatimonadota bacterium]